MNDVGLQRKDYSHVHFFSIPFKIICKTHLFLNFDFAKVASLVELVPGDQKVVRLLWYLPDMCFCTVDFYLFWWAVFTATRVWMCLSTGKGHLVWVVSTPKEHYIKAAQYLLLCATKNVRGGQIPQKIRENKYFMVHKVVTGLSFYLPSQGSSLIATLWYLMIVWQKYVFVPQQRSMS